MAESLKAFSDLRTQHHFLAPTWWFTAVFISSSKGSGAGFWLLQAMTTHTGHIQAEKLAKNLYTD